jgi:hypothetical protein
MDSQSQAFASLLEAPIYDSGVPLRCPQPMPVQPLNPWTLTRVAGAVLTAMVSRPAALVPLTLTNRNRRA